MPVKWSNNESVFILLSQKPYANINGISFYFVVLFFPYNAAIFSSYLSNVWLIEVVSLILMTFLILFIVQKKWTSVCYYRLIISTELYTSVLYVFCSESFPFVEKRLNKCLGSNLRSISMKSGTVSQIASVTSQIMQVEWTGRDSIQYLSFSVKQFYLAMVAFCHEGR